MLPNKGFVIPILVIAIGVIAALGGGFWAYQKRQPSQPAEEPFSQAKTEIPTGQTAQPRQNELGLSSSPSSLQPSSSTKTSEQKPNPALCPDNSWDAAEQTDPTLCPEDNPKNNPLSVVAKTMPQDVLSSPQASATTTPLSAAGPSSQTVASSSDWEYLAFLEKLPSLPTIETWRFEYDVGSGGAFVPDIAEYNGALRMYAYLPLTGIISFSSGDGKTWAKDAGVRITESGKYSHPYAVIAPNDKLYLFMQTGKEGVIFSVSRAESSDGLNFTDPQLALNGTDFGSTHAAHGRIIKLADGTYMLAISSGINGKGPQPGTSLLYSSDLETWDFKSVYFAGCHDPTLDATSGGGVRLYCQYQGDKIVRFDSTDGYKWEPQNPAGIVRFENESDTALGMTSYASADDIDVHTFGDGTKRIFVSVHTPPGTANVKIWGMVKK